MYLWRGEGRGGGGKGMLQNRKTKYRNSSKRVNGADPKQPYIRVIFKKNSSQQICFLYINQISSNTWFDYVALTTTSFMTRPLLGNANLVG